MTIKTKRSREETSAFFPTILDATTYLRSYLLDDHQHFSLSILQLLAVFTQR
jgi:hypothetical protein